MMLYEKQINIVFACSISSDGKLIIGNKGDMPWRGKVPSDIERFKNLTTGHSVIMGRKTWDSIPDKFKPLEYRQNIIITRNPEFAKNFSDHDLHHSHQIVVADSFEKAVWSADLKEICVIGGAEIFALALPFTDYIHQTVVSGNFDGDTFSPEFNMNEWRKIDLDFRNAGGVMSQNDKFDTFYKILERKK